MLARNSKICYARIMIEQINLKSYIEPDGIEIVSVKELRTIEDYIDTKIFYYPEMERYTSTTKSEYIKFSGNESLKRKFRGADTFALVPIHAIGDFESENIENMLNQYWTNQQIPKHQYGIILFANSSEIAKDDPLRLKKLVNRNRTNISIKRWQENNPDANLIVVNKVFEEDQESPVTIGGIRKTITDFALLITESNNINEAAFLSLDSDVIRASEFLVNELSNCVLINKQHLAIANINWEGFYEEVLNNDLLCYKLLRSKVDTLQFRRKRNYEQNFPSENGSVISKQHYIQSGGYQDVNMSEGSIFIEELDQNVIQTARTGWLDSHARRVVQGIMNDHETWDDQGWVGKGEKARFGNGIEKYRIDYDPKLIINELNLECVNDIGIEVMSYIYAVIKEVINRNIILALVEEKLAVIIIKAIKKAIPKLMNNFKYRGFEVSFEKALGLKPTDLIKYLHFDFVNRVKLPPLEYGVDGLQISCIEAIKITREWTQEIEELNQIKFDFENEENKKLVSQFHNKHLDQIRGEFVDVADVITSVNSSRFRRLINYQRKIRGLRDFS